MTNPYTIKSGFIGSPAWILIEHEFDVDNDIDTINYTDSDHYSDVEHYED
jgi:hypothetical protein